MKKIFYQIFITVIILILKNDRKVISPQELDIVIPEKKIAFEFIFEGVYGTIIEWIKNDYAPKEEIALQLAHLLNNNWKLVFDDEHLINILRKSKK